MDLFDLVESSETSAHAMTGSAVGESASVAADDESCDATAEVGGAQKAQPGYTAAWLQYLRRTVELSALNAHCEAETNAAFGSSYGVLEGRFDLSNRITQVRGWILASIVARAGEDFAVPGATLVIDQGPMIDALGEKTGVDRERHSGGSWEEREDRLNRAFDPDEIWCWLENEYGGDAGELLTLKQTARALINAMGLERKPPTQRGANLVVTVYAYSEKKFRGGREYSYSSLGSLSELRNKLATFATWAQAHATRTALSFTRHSSLSYGGDLTSREKLAFGDMHWITYNDKVEIVFSPSLGEKFRLFIAEFGADD